MWILLRALDVEIVDRASLDEVCDLPEYPAWLRRSSIASLVLSEKAVQIFLTSGHMMAVRLGDAPLLMASFDGEGDVCATRLSPDGIEAVCKDNALLLPSTLTALPKQPHEMEERNVFVCRMAESLRFLDRYVRNEAEIDPDTDEAEIDPDTHEEEDDPDTHEEEADPGPAPVLAPTFAPSPALLTIRVHGGPGGSSKYGQKAYFEYTLERRDAEGPTVVDLPPDVVDASVIDVRRHLRSVRKWGAAFRAEMVLVREDGSAIGEIVNEIWGEIARDAQTEAWKGETP